MPGLELPDLAATLDLGRRLGSAARAGDVVLLEGRLGAGKTALVRGIAEGLGSTDEVLSPTFVLVRHYRGRLALVHADLYRLEDPRDVDRLGLLELADEGVLVVEWPERSPRLDSFATLRIRLDLGPSGGARTGLVLSAAKHLEVAVMAASGPP
ncbi:MAG: tRNA (adenosine(37)-N6)-threonylcarbamoyltransferase complex ATPase subunit type 1 TsaE [Candidatus Dormibacteria bacterium]